MDRKAINERFSKKYQYILAVAKEFARVPIGSCETVDAVARRIRPQAVAKARLAYDAIIRSGHHRSAARDSEPLRDEVQDAYYVDQLLRLFAVLSFRGEAPFSSGVVKLFPTISNLGCRGVPRAMRFLLCGAELFATEFGENAVDRIVAELIRCETGTSRPRVSTLRSLVIALVRRDLRLFYPRFNLDVAFRKTVTRYFEISNSRVSLDIGTYVELLAQCSTALSEHCDWV